MLLDVGQRFACWGRGDAGFIEDFGEELYALLVGGTLVQRSAHLPCDFGRWNAA